MPLKLTEERIRAESQRHQRAGDLDSVLLHGRAAWQDEGELAPRKLPGTVAPPATAQSKGAQIPAPLNDPAQSKPDPDAQATRVRPRRALRTLRWAVVIALIFAFAGAAADRYLILRSNAQLPGAGAVRLLQAEAVRAREELQELKRSELSTEVIALGHKARPALAEASHRAQQLLDKILDRYQQWRARG